LKTFSVARILLATCLLASATFATAAPTLLVTNGMLMGAKNVSVDGTLYNVSFKEGSCSSLFNGCLQSAFAFNTPESAVAAARALLDQVFLDGPAGNFNSQSKTTFGCEESYCMNFIPYNVSFGGIEVDFAYSQNSDSATLADIIRLAAVEADQDTSLYPDRNFAVFEIATPDATVPEPSTMALLGLALAGMTTLRRRKS
jgi:hypothetical protein